MQKVRVRPLVRELRSHTLQAIQAHTPQLPSPHTTAREKSVSCSYWSPETPGPQWETPHATAKIPHATTKTWGSQMNKWINSFFFKGKDSDWYIKDKRDKAPWYRGQCPGNVWLLLPGSSAIFSCWLGFYFGGSDRYYTPCILAQILFNFQLQCFIPWPPSCSPSLWAAVVSLHPSTFSVLPSRPWELLDPPTVQQASWALSLSHHTVPEFPPATHGGGGFSCKAVVSQGNRR